MKKSIYKVLILLVIISMSAIACSSDKKDESKDKKKTTTTKEKDISDDSDSSDSDMYAPITKEEYEENIILLKEESDKSCKVFQDAYEAYKTPSQEDDGFYDIINVTASLRYWLIGGGEDGATGPSQLSAELNWPEYNLNDDFEVISAPDYFLENLIPFQDELDKFADRLQANVDAAVDDMQTAAQQEELHQIVKEASDYINTTEFGPCDV